jgi:Mn-dependent DtxR family transcriptional regulator
MTLDYIFKPFSVIQDTRLSSSEADYLCLIAVFQNNGGCVASNNYFASRFGVKRQAAQRTINGLKIKGFITTNEEKSGGKTIRRTIEIIDEVSKQRLLKVSNKMLPLDSNKMLPINGLVSNESLPLDSNKSYTHIIQDNNTTTTAKKQKPFVYDETFQRFWEVYPRKENKAESHRQWRKLKPDAELIEKIIGDVKRRSQSPVWLKEDGKYVLSPKNYLHDQRWTDEKPEPKRGEPGWLPDEAEVDAILAETPQGATT